MSMQAQETLRLQDLEEQARLDEAKAEEFAGAGANPVAVNFDPAAAGHEESQNFELDQRRSEEPERTHPNPSAPPAEDAMLEAS